MDEPQDYYFHYYHHDDVPDRAYGHSDLLDQKRFLS